ncbi:MAG: DUF1376 domain-containing protein [Deltaproteobacteria bacterium]|nr:DUF1376 domain-containing protein [Deltaproteobacteria bacterium]
MSDAVDVSISMPVHVGDTMRETAHLSGPEMAAHVRLMMAAWSRGGHLPSESERLRRLAMVDAPDWSNVWFALAELWPASTDGQSVSHARTLAELVRARAAKAHAVARAKHARAQQLAGPKPAPSRPQAGPPSPSPSPTPDPEPEPTPTPRSGVGAEPPADGPAPAPAAPPEPALLVYACSGRRGEPREWPFTESIRAELAEAYPGIDVMASARQMLEHFRAHPQKRPTAKGMRARLSTWCRDDQDRGGRPGLRVVPPARDVRAGAVRAEAMDHSRTGRIDL